MCFLLNRVLGVIDLWLVCSWRAEVCEVAETDAAVAAMPIHYQCLECLALFETPEMWMAHRQTHGKISTHSQMSEAVSKSTNLFIKSDWENKKILFAVSEEWCWCVLPFFWVMLHIQLGIKPKHIISSADVFNSVWFCCVSLSLSGLHSSAGWYSHPCGQRAESSARWGEGRTDPDSSTGKPQWEKKL